MKNKLLLLLNIYFQFLITANVQSVSHLIYALIHAWTCQIMDCHTFSKILGQLRFHKLQRCIGIVDFRYQFKLHKW